MNYVIRPHVPQPKEENPPKWECINTDIDEFRITFGMTPQSAFSRYMDEELKYGRGCEFEKTGGDYTFKGTVVAPFKKLNGTVRYVGENADGLLFIFNESSMKPIYEKK